MNITNIKAKGFICIALIFFLLMGNTGNTFAAITESSDAMNRTEEFTLDGDTYLLRTQALNDKIIATVYNEDGKIESEFVNDLKTGNLEGIFLQDVATVGSMATSTDYKLVSSSEGSLKPASWTVVAIIAAIASLNPTAGAAAIATLASAIVSDAGTSYKYTLDIWTKSESTFFYQKNVFKLYNRETGKKVGPDLVTEHKVRQK